MKYVVVTGAASGIGECIANKCTELGYTVWGIDKRPCFGKFNSIECDISNENEVIKAAKLIRKEQPHIDYVIHSAGIFSIGSPCRVSDITTDEWQSVMDIDLTGTFLTAKHFSPMLEENGCFLTFSSEQVVKPNVKSAPYAVAKAGVEMLMRILSLELLPKKVRVNTIALGSVRTDFIRHLVSSDEELTQIMQNTNESMTLGIIETEDVWNFVSYLLSDDCKVTGQIILLDSGITLR